MRQYEYRETSNGQILASTYRSSEAHKGSPPGTTAWHNSVNDNAPARARAACAARVRGLKTINMPKTCPELRARTEASMLVSRLSGLQEKDCASRFCTGGGWLLIPEEVARAVAVGLS